MIVWDTNGRKIGEVRKSNREGEFNTYDRNGQPSGRVRENGTYDNRGQKRSWTQDPGLNIDRDR